MAAPLAMAGALLFGCAVGPDFRTPALSTEAGYTAAPLPPETTASPVPGGVAQRFAAGGEIAAMWWTLFRCEPLDRLINLAFSNSPTLAAAEAALRQAQENRRAQLGVFFPSFDGQFSVERSKVLGAGFGQPNRSLSPFTIYDASINVSYSPDVFGGARRELEALQAQVDYRRFQMEAAYLSLSANVVTSAVREAALRGRIEASREMIQLQQQQLALVEVRFRAGAVSEIDVAAQRAQLAQTLATLPPLEKELSQTRHLLSVLAGKFPSEGRTLPEFRLDALHLPQELPVSLPSELVRQRPDVLASEELFHAASAQVGVATANLYPQINLTGSLGSEAVSIGSLFGAGSSVWSLGAGVVQPLFHGGELTARRRAAIAAYQEAGAQYRQTVLQAFQDVADVLRALDRDAATLKAQSEAVQAAGKTLQLTVDQLRSGAVSYLSVVDADRQYHLALLNQIEAQAARYADTAALFQALGGGWWNRGRVATVTPSPSATTPSPPQRSP